MNMMSSKSGMVEKREINKPLEGMRERERETERERER
jgi:hypothetical protein